jgi:hypothetical protein
MNTTFSEKIYSRWCCIDRLNGRRYYSQKQSHFSWIQIVQKGVCSNLGMRYRLEIGKTGADGMNKRQGKYFKRSKAAETSVIEQPFKSCSTA